MRRSTSLFIAVLFLVTASSAHPAAAKPAPVEIEVGLLTNAASLDTFREIAREYEAIRPGVRVNLYGDAHMPDKVQVRVLEGTYPEVINSSQNNWRLVDAGLILPLDEFLDQSAWDGGGVSWRGSFLPGVLDRYTYQGKTYGIPFAYHTHSIWYDKRLFARRGWRPPRTWDEWFALCEQIKSAGIAPIAFPGRWPYYSQRLIDSAYFQLAGRERLDQQKTLRLGSFDNPEMIESLRLVQHLATRYFQDGCWGMGNTEAQLQLLLGIAAMMSSGSWLGAELEGKLPPGFELGTFNYPLPGGRGDSSAVYSSAGYLFVFGKSKHPREAADFLRYLTSRPAMTKFARRAVPAAVKGVNTGSLPPELADMAALLDAARISYDDSAGERYLAMGQYWSDLYPDLLQGRITPEQAAKQLERSAAVVRARMDNPGLVETHHRFKPAAFLLLIALAGGYVVLRSLRTCRRQQEQASRIMPASSGRLRMSRGALCLFLGPPMLVYGVFVLIPSLRSLSWSMEEWDGLTAPLFVGLRNFRRLLFESDTFWIALRNNLFIMLVVPCFVLPLSLFLAACLNRRLRGWRILRIALFFPNVLGSVAIALLWLHIYSPQGGLLNGAMIHLARFLAACRLNALAGWFASFQSFAWLSHDHLFWSLVPVMVWGGCGFNIVLFLAAMEGIPDDLYEVAEIEGASAWRQFWAITLPLIWDVLAVAVVFMVIGGMKTFEIVWLLTDQMPPTDNHVIGTLMVQAMFTHSRIGEATAIAVLLFLIVALGTLVSMRAMRREAVEM